MVPLQYIINSSDLLPALSSGCSWIQTLDVPENSAVQTAHEAGSYLLLTDDVETCKEVTADGVVLTESKIDALAASVPEPSGIVLQRPLPITTAISAARQILGEDSPQMIGVSVTSATDAVAAAKAGADFIQVPKSNAVELLKAVRDRSFTTPIVALDVTEPEETLELLDAGISGIACIMSDVPPIIIPSLLNADE